MDEIKPVRHILDTHTRHVTRKAKSNRISVLMELEDSANALKRNYLGMFACLVSIGMLGVTILLWEEFPSDITRAIVLSSIGTILATIFIVALQKRTQIKKFAKNLEVPIKELATIRDGLFEYQQEIDQRTSKYFHCVTNNKITAYFIVMQFITALDERVNDLEKLLKRPTRMNVQAAHALLHKDLVFSDSVVAETGNLRSVPVFQMEAAISEITRNLESGLDLLEREIAVAESQMPDSDKPSDDW